VCVRREGGGGTSCGRSFSRFPFSLFPRAQPGAADEVRRIRVPPNRFTPLKEQWDALVKPVTEQMKLLIRMNTKAKAIELKVRDERESRRHKTACCARQCACAALPAIFRACQ
jgi:hypothetical protein